MDKTLEAIVLASDTTPFITLPDTSFKRGFPPLVGKGGQLTSWVEGPSVAGGSTLHF